MAPRELWRHAREHARLYAQVIFTGAWITAFFLLIWFATRLALGQERPSVETHHKPSITEARLDLQRVLMGRLMGAYDQFLLHRDYHKIRFAHAPQEWLAYRLRDPLSDFDLWVRFSFQESQERPNQRLGWWPGGGGGIPPDWDCRCWDWCLSREAHSHRRMLVLILERKLTKMLAAGDRGKVEGVAARGESSLWRLHTWDMSVDKLRPGDRIR